MYLVLQTKHPGNDAGLAEHVYSWGVAHTHTPDNTITFRANPTHRLTGYEPGDALLDLQITVQPVQAQPFIHAIPYIPSGLLPSNYKQSPCALRPRLFPS